MAKISMVNLIMLPESRLFVFKHLSSRPWWIKGLVLYVFFVLYLIIFFSQKEVFSYSTLSLSLILPALGGRLFGLRAGILIGILTFPLNVYLASTIPSIGMSINSIFLNNLFGGIIAISLGAVLGHLNDLEQDLNEKFNELTLNEERFRKYLDVVNLVIVVIDKEEKVILINKTGCELLGYSEEEIVGNNWFDKFLASDVRIKIKKAFHQILEGSIEKFEYAENKIQTKFGERIIAWHNSILLDKEGKPYATLSAGQDITKKIASETELIERTKELERMNELMIGRELKMKELKEKIKLLESKNV